MRDTDVLKVIGFCTVLAVAGAPLRVAAQAAIARYSLDIPREPLDMALKSFARQTGLQIARFSDTGRPDTLVGPIAESLTSEQALTALLADTGLTYRVLNDGTIAVIEPRRAPDTHRIGPSPAQAHGTDPGNVSAKRERRSGQSQLEEVVIMGIQASSLEKGLVIKQQAVGIVDALAAEDMGQFPDASIGAAIAAISGVTVDRGTVSIKTSAGWTTSTGSVSGITVRGFGSSFNESLVNNRPIASALGQSFDFSSLGSQWVNEVDVLKTPDFSLSAGEVGATVNIRFRNPLDHSGIQAQAYLSTTDYPTDGGFQPGGGFLWSNTFLDNTLGILVDGDYSDRHITTHHLQIRGWGGAFRNCSQYATLPAGCTSPTQTSPLPSWTPLGMAMFLEQADERRKEGRLAIQWQPTDGVLVTLDDNFSSYEQKIDRFQIGTELIGNPADIVTDGNGTIISFVQDTPQPYNFYSFVDDTYLVTNTPGINIKWDLSEQWTAEFDGDQSESKLNPKHTYSDIGVGTTHLQGTDDYIDGVVITGNNSVPHWTAIASNAEAARSPQPADFFGFDPRGAQAQIAVARMSQARLAATWHTDNTLVRFGFQWVDDSYSVRKYDTFHSSDATGYGSLYPPSTVQLSPSLFTPVNISNFIPGFSGNEQLPPRLIQYNPYALANYPCHPSLDTGSKPANAYYTFCMPGAMLAPALDPNSVANIERRTISPFIIHERDFQLGRMKLRADVGLRYQKTDVTVSGLVAPLAGLSTLPGDLMAYGFTLGPSQLTTMTNSYRYILPSLDLNLAVRPDFKLRLDASRTETAAPNSLLVPNPTYGGRVDFLTGAAHNPQLLPYLSNNFDLGAEWYYAYGSYVSVDRFLKHVTQFPAPDTKNVTLTNIIDPNPTSHTFGKPATFTVTTSVNGPAANVDGVELTWQQVLPLGFGFQIDGAYIHTNKPFRPHNFEPDTVQFALPGIGNSAHFTGFYQNSGFQARVAVHWQAAQLTSFGQEQFGTEPTFLEASTNIDFSSSYDINEHLSAFFEAFNLTDAEYHTRGRFSNQLLNVVDYGRSFTMGVRANF